MLGLPPSVKIYMAKDPIDMRKGFDGLCAIVRSEWLQDVFAGNLFVFLSKRRDRIKILYWDRGGFVLYCKRLERGRFKAPRLIHNDSAFEIDAVELAMLLDGIDFKKVKRSRIWRPYKGRSPRGIDKEVMV